MTSAKNGDEVFLLAERSIVALEGGMAVGKSSVLELLATFDVGIVVPEYATLISDQEQIEINALDPSKRIRAFLSLEKQRLPAKALPPGQPLLLDRSVFTLFAFEYACVEMGLNSRSTDLCATLDGSFTIIPDKIFFLDASDSIRGRRLLKRDTAHLPLLADPDLNQHLRNFFELVAKHFTVSVLTTDERSVEQLAVLLSEEVGRMKPTEERLERLYRVIEDAFGH